jgi:voltage-gated potassium channel
MRQTGNTMNWDELDDHILICGWNRKAEIIVGEYVSAKPGVPIAVIAKLDGDPQFTDPNLRKEIQFLNEDFTKAAALELAGVRRASTCIILSDTTRGRNERDADARTVLTALTVEKLNPEVYTCAELNRREYSDHLALGNVNSFVVSGEHSAFLLAQAALNQAALGIFSELLSYSAGNRFCRLRVPESWKGKTFFEALVIVKEKHDAILIAVADGKGGMTVNPHAYVFEGGEEAVAITTKDIDIRDV